MKLVKPASWVFLGLLAAITGGVHAQEATQKPRQSAESASPNLTDSYETLLHNAEALIESGKPGDAYHLLEPFEFEHAGEVRFDYLLGIAALDSGQPDKATFILERVLTVKPDYAAARLEMGRAYYQLGDLPRARAEFAAILKQNPPAEMRASVQKYLEAIDERQSGQRTQFSGYLEATLGRDSNVNSSTSQQRIFIDFYSISTTLQPSSIKASDNYYAVAVGGELRHSLNGRWGIYAGADLRKRGNQTETQFDQASLEARAGVAHETQSDRVRFGALSGQYQVDGSRNSGTAGLKAEWRHKFSPANQLNALVQQVQYRYAGIEMQPNDFDQRAIGLGWLHVLADGRSALSGSIHSGAEQDVSTIVTTASPDGGRNDGAKRFRGVRIAGQTGIGESTTLFASAGMQTGDYDKVNYYFLRQRRDRLYDLTLGANWRWDRQWTLRPQLGYTRNDSNIVIYGYNRTYVSLTLRRDFR